MKLRANKSQSTKFIETARKLGCDEDEAAFDKKLKKIGGHKLLPGAKPKKKVKK